jgi:membrane associated rhomboid family serine protease
MLPFTTPKPLKTFLLITLALGLASPLLFPYLALSAAGVKALYLWQFITYAFVLPTLGGLSFSLLILLAFNIYLLWMFGSSLIERIKVRPFFLLYFTSILVGGLAGYLAMRLFSLPLPLGGMAAPLYGVLIAWVLLNPGANLLIDLSHGDWIHVISYAAVAIYVYVYTLIVFAARGPFAALHRFERKVQQGIDGFRKVWKRPKTAKGPKVYDIRSGNPILSDDAFMDQMLAKISSMGEQSLTEEERRRMHEISKKKSK